MKTIYTILFFLLSCMLFAQEQQEKPKEHPVVFHITHGIGISYTTASTTYKLDYIAFSSQSNNNKVIQRYLSRFIPINFDMLFELSSRAKLGIGLSIESYRIIKYLDNILEVDGYTYSDIFTNYYLLFEYKLFKIYKNKIGATGCIDAGTFSKPSSPFNNITYKLQYPICSNMGIRFDYPLNKKIEIYMKNQYQIRYNETQKYYIEKLGLFDITLFTGIKVNI